MNTVSPACMPQLYPVTISDWIPKLGEKAFLAWLQFHSWKNENAAPKDPQHLPFSLNKIIKLLKIGKNTFYEKILQPLLKYGFIRLHPTGNGRQEIHIVIYSFPANCPENATKTLKPMPNSEDPATEEDEASFDHPLRKPHPTPTPNDPTPRSKDQDDDNLKSHLVLETLPIEIQQKIEKDPRLLERVPGIVQAYQSLNKHPTFNLDDFVQKMQICLKYCHDKNRFGAYLYKALLNEWKKPASPLNSFPKPPRTRPHDVPEWVWRQQESPPESNSTDEEEIDPELKAEIEDLLRQLGEIE